MLRHFWVLGRSCFLLLLVLLAAHSTFAQLETATVSGQVVDPSGLSITRAQVKLVDIDRDTTTITATNPSGLYTFPSVRPGRYRMEVTAAGFKVVNVTGLTVNVQDHLDQNFKLAVGSVSESVTVEGGAPLVDTESAAVSTVVDRHFAENLPMNGRSFQTLIQLTPGVVLTASNSEDTGQFSVNGQRAVSNYWTVDGVSANVGVGIPTGGAPGNGLGGALGSFSVLGGTNSLVSVDALQEFRIQTSTYAPEFGRTPGGQISIVTRSGTNQFHGTAFDYLRNDIFDANNWFNTFVTPALPRAKERQNDFGGTLGGPILKNRIFFFFSYEGLRLRLPQTTLTTVPDLNARQTAVATMQPFLNAYPIPNGPEVLDGTGNATGAAQFNASYSNPATLDAYSIRIDHKPTEKLALFGRYDYSPSEIVQRGNGNSLSTVSPTRITTQTATVGLTWFASPALANDARFNYSRTNASSLFFLDAFGGSIPITSLPYPSPFTNQDAEFELGISSLTNGYLNSGTYGHNLQRQINVVDSLSAQKGSHGLKFGVDFRRLTPVYANQQYSQFPFFADVSSAESGNAYYGLVASGRGATFLFRDLGIFAQDTWRVAPRITLTYGLRWDVEFVPRSVNGPSLNAVTGFNLNNLSNLALLPAGTAPYKTTYGNIAPRFGVAYQLTRSQDWQAVLRGGFGVFYDLATSEVGNILANAYPFGVYTSLYSIPFPFDAATAAAPPIVPPNTSNGEPLWAFNPHLDLPYTFEWNVALEQTLRGHQSISAAYVGSAGRRLLQTAFVNSPNTHFASAGLITNASTSNYNALQVQFQRRLSGGLQGLASYTWSHSIDTASAGSLYGNEANALVPAINPNANRGPSDFDVRNALSAGVTYDIPAPKRNALANAIIRGWSVQNVIQARSAQPVDISDSNFLELHSAQADVRPDLVPGQPLYLYGSACASVFQSLAELIQGQGCPGGKGFNPNALTNPPTDSNGNPLRQGDLGRNALRGFDSFQWDFAVHREFPIHESLKLQFRAEMFNILNHPNFGPPSGCFGLFCSTDFGLSNNMLGQSLSGGQAGGGAFNPLYQIGGPRSLQFAMKLEF
jgi:hypothetical protein